MFSWRNKKNINTFGLKKAPLLVLCSIMQLDQDLSFVSVDSVVSRLARYKLVQVITIHIEITTFKGGNKKLLNLQSITLMVQFVTVQIEMTTFKGGNKKLLNLQSITLKRKKKEVQYIIILLSVFSLHLETLAAFENLLYCQQW